MGSSSSSYAPKSIYLDVDGKVQKVDPFFSCFYPHLTISSLNPENSICHFAI